MEPTLLQLTDHSTPVTCINELFEASQTGQAVSIPDFCKPGCRISGVLHWAEADRNRLVSRFRCLETNRPLSDSPFFSKEIFQPFCKDAYDGERREKEAEEIFNSLIAQSESLFLAQKLLRLGRLNEADQERLTACMKQAPSDDSRNRYLDFSIQARQEAGALLASPLFAVEVVFLFRRLYRIISENQNASVSYTACLLAQTLVFHLYTNPKQQPSEKIRKFYDAFWEYSEEETDEYYRSKTSNSRKSMAPLFVYFVLQKYSSPNQPLLQKEILAYLQKDYELELGRKALGRILHYLAGDNLGIVHVPSIGSWLDPYFDA